MVVDTLAADVIRWCRALASCSETPGATFRTFLCPSMRDVHRQLSAWMQRLGLVVHVDAAGNLRGVRAAAERSTPPRRLVIGSHLDTVPNAGAFDGVLGVVAAIALIELLGPVELPLDIEVVGFSEEEGVRFAFPFIGSRALAGTLDAELLGRTDANGTTVRDALLAYGCDPQRMAEARLAADAIGYFEIHIEQGPVLDTDDHPLGIVDAIAGQTRATVAFSGRAAHAGTTPASARRDALAAAAEWTLEVERLCRATPSLMATVGRLDIEPNASNVIAGRVAASLDVRHADDEVRIETVSELTGRAVGVAERRGIDVSCTTHLDQPAVHMDDRLSRLLQESVIDCGVAARRLTSGAGHDAMILAPVVPTAMLFVRSPDGISHSPDESVLESDVAAALRVGLRFIERLAREYT